MFQLAKLPAGPVLTFGAIVLPALVVWWTGRALARNADDPLIAERLLASRVRTRYALAFAWVVLIAFASDAAWWAIPLMVAVRALGAYPLRRVLQGETWSPIQYLWFFCRLTVAFGGFWLLLIGTPELAGRAGGADWLVGIAIGAALLVWNEYFVDAIRFALRSRPIGDAALTERLAHLASQSDVRAPRIEVVPMGGGVLANAVALPSRRQPTVLMTSTFVERFDADEIVAVCAHELAHLEYYSGARLRRLRFTTIALVAAATLIQPAARLLAPAAAPWAFMSWVVFVFSFQAIRARSRQKNETASDVRAVALTGDGEALVRALVKLHATARVPRRWAAQMERHATHPSLARRIKAIREAAGHTAAPLEKTETFRSGSTAITLDRERLHWGDTDLAHSVAYTRLTELRLVLSRAQAPQLLAVDRSGQRWTFPLAAGDVSRVQHALDVVDGQLAPAPAPPTVSAVGMRLMSLLTMVVAVSASQIAVLVPLLLAIVRPSAALVAGAAAGALASALVLWRDGAPLFASSWIGWSVTLALCSGALLGFAWLGRKDDEPPAAWQPLALLSTCTLLAWIALLLSGTSAVRLHQSAHASAAGIVFPVALAVALAWTRRGAVRRAATPIGLIAAIAFAMGSRTYLESFARDRFLGEGPALSTVEVDAPPASEAPVGSDSAIVRLSPNGRFVAIGSDADDDQPRAFQVGPASGPFETIECDDLFFADDRLLLTVSHQREAVLLRELELTQGFPVARERRLGPINGAGVSFSQATGIWTLLGTGANDDVVRIEGHVGGKGAEVERHWPSPQSDATSRGWIQAVAASGDNVLMRRSRYHVSPFGYGYFAALTYALAPTWMESDFWIAGSSGSRPLGTSGLNVECHAVTAASRPVCAAFDGSRTTLFAIDLAAGQLDATATMHGRFIGDEDNGSAWLGGFVDERALIVRADGGEAWRIRAPDGEWVRAIAANDGTIAAIVSRGAGQVIRTYPAPSAAITGRSPRRR